MNLLFDEFLLTCQKLREDNISFVIATLTDKKNSVPQDIGSKIIVTLNGIAFGTVGGGALENKTIKIAQKLLEDHNTITLYKEFNLNRDLKMTCGGSVTILFEKVQTKQCWQIVVFGAGHVSQAVIRTLLNLDCRIKCIDIRDEWLKKLPNSPKLELIKVSEYTEVIEEISLDSYVLIMTPGHTFDFPILRKILTKDRFPYVGVIGAKNKRARLDKDLKKLGIEKNFFCPIGERFGTNNPNEIAISIIAQLLKIRDGEDKN
jgi:xanthine dehydrogenase accessory factor